jgi:hypothetical protein
MLDTRIRLPEPPKESRFVWCKERNQRITIEKCRTCGWFAVCVESKGEEREGND